MGNNLVDLYDMEQARRLYHALDTDLCLFAKTVMGHIVKEVPKFHKDAYAIIDAGYEYSAFVWARGLGKSTISHTIQATRDVCHAKEAHIVLLSETLDQASADLISVQDEIESNEIIHQLYGNLKGNVWNIQSTEFANGCYICCRGYTSRIRGVKWKNVRPSKIILDDFESEQNSASADQRAEVQRWLYGRVLPATEVKTAKYQFWGTIVHPEAFLAKCKDLSFFKSPTGTYMEVPIETDGVAAWGSRYPIKWINLTKDRYMAARQATLFYQEYYNRPALSGNPRFRPDMILPLDVKFDKYGTITYIVADNGKKQPVYTFIGVDPASSLSDAADFSIFTVVAALPGVTERKYLILDQVAERCTPTQQRDILFRLVEKYTPRLVTIETQGYQLALEDICREKMRTSGLYFPIKGFKTTKSKAMKWLLGLEPQINSGNVYRIAHLNLWGELEKQLVSYNENIREHDDCIDGLYLAVQNAYCPQPYDVDRAINDYKNKDRQQPSQDSWFTL